MKIILKPKDLYKNCKLCGNSDINYSIQIDSDMWSLYIRCLGASNSKLIPCGRIFLIKQVSMEGL